MNWGTVLVHLRTIVGADRVLDQSQHCIVPVSPRCNKNLSVHLSRLRYANLTVLLCVILLYDIEVHPHLVQLGQY